MLTPAEAAWIALLPCALLTLASIVVLGAALGHLLLEPGAEGFWPELLVNPQPAQHGRFLVALIGPPLLAAAVLASSRPQLAAQPRLPPTTIHRAVLAGQLGTVAFVAACLAAQNNVLLSADFTHWPHRAYFTWPTLVVALAAPALLLWLLRGRQLADTVRRRARETPTRRAVCLALATLYVAVWMLTAIDLDSSIGNTSEAVSGQLMAPLGEAFGVLNGRTPLVDLHVQYGQLWAYLAAAPMSLFGATIGSYTIVMASASGLAMLGVYAIFRRVVRSSLIALALFVPFLATACFTIIGPLSDRYGPQNIFMLWPIRYAGPFALAWLTARHIDGAAPRRVWLLFVVAGLAAVNNPDFGLAGAIATFVALAGAASLRSWRAAGRLAAQAAGGVALGVAAFALLTLLHSGALPKPALLFEFARIYGIGGWGQDPMPELGLHLAIFLTFAAALVLAAVRVASRGGDPLLTGMLGWIGAFGLLASLYFAGRAHPMALIDFFAPWAFAVVLLLIVVVRALDGRSWRRPTLPELAVLSAFGLVVCSLPQVPAPWEQVARIRDRTAATVFQRSLPDGTSAPVFAPHDAERFVAATTRPGERVAIVTPLGHRVAYDAGVTNVSPYVSLASMSTQRQLRRTIDALRDAGGRKLYLALAFTLDAQWMALEGAGFSVRRHDRTGAFAELVASR
jgi:hypothetical protein